MKTKIKIFNLIDYKGKYSFIQDVGLEDGEDDIVIGKISKDRAIKEAAERREACAHYGIPAYVGVDPELISVYKTLKKNKKHGLPKT